MWIKYVVLSVCKVKKAGKFIECRNEGPEKTGTLYGRVPAQTKGGKNVNEAAFSTIGKPPVLSSIFMSLYPTFCYSPNTFLTFFLLNVLMCCGTYMQWNTT